MAGASLGSAAGRRAVSARPVGTPVTGSAKPPDRPPLPAGYVRFGMTDDPYDYVDALTTDEPELPTADSGWDVVNRPLKIDATVWRSGKPLRQDIAITMDVLAAARRDTSVSVSDEWYALQQLWRPANGAIPPVLRVTGPVSRTELRWVISNVAPDQASVKRIAGRLVRAEMVVSLLQYVPPDLTTDEGADSTSRTRATRPRFETARTGDTLRKIAQRRLGNGRKWTVLRDLNPTFKTATETIPRDTSVRLPNG